MAVSVRKHPSGQRSFFPVYWGTFWMILPFAISFMPQIWSNVYTPFGRRKCKMIQIYAFQNYLPSFKGYLVLTWKELWLTVNKTPGRYVLILSCVVWDIFMLMSVLVLKCRILNKKEWLSKQDHFPCSQGHLSCSHASPFKFKECVSCTFISRLIFTTNNLLTTVVVFFRWLTFPCYASLLFWGQRYPL